jgi:hypothetical protein
MPRSSISILGDEFFWEKRYVPELHLSWSKSGVGTERLFSSTLAVAYQVARTHRLLLFKPDEDLSSESLKD